MQKDFFVIVYWFERKKCDKRKVEEVDLFLMINEIDYQIFVYKLEECLKVWDWDRK